MVTGHAELLVVLRYRADLNAFDVSLAYDDPSDPEDRRDFVDEPLKIDLDRLQDLVIDNAAYGDALSSMLFSDPKTRSFYDKAMNTARGMPLNLKLLVDPRAPRKYHAVRWESLRDPGTGAWIAMQHNVRLSRYLSSPDWRSLSLLPMHQLNALVVIADPADLHTKDRAGGGKPLEHFSVDDELVRAKTALDGMNLTVLASRGAATLEGVIAALENIDVFYLVCHGGLAGDEPRLYLEDVHGNTSVADGSHLAERIADLPKQPAIAVLCSCQSAGNGDRAMSSDDGALSSLGPRLAAAGVAAVVAMQGDITMTTAATFIPAFLREVVKDGYVERAMAVARGTISDRDKDWWVPVLFSRLRAGRNWYSPEFTGRADSPFKALVTQIEIGLCTPIIGSGIAGEGFLPSREELAASWADRWQMPIAAHSRSDLAKVAQYLGVRIAANQPKSELRRYLITEFKKKYKDSIPEDLWDSSDPNPLLKAVSDQYYSTTPVHPYKILASLRLPIYITTSWTALLEDALEAAGAEPTVLSFNWHKDRHRSRNFPDPDAKHPLVFHLFGRIDDPPSLVLTEDDYFAWLRAWISYKETKAVVPLEVTSALTQSSLLFLGYRLDDWEFRVLFQSIKTLPGSVALRKNLHAGVQLSPDNDMLEPEATQDYLEKYLGSDNVAVYWGTSARFLEELRAQMRGLS
jgi:hypothetical protein